MEGVIGPPAITDELVAAAVCRPGPEREQLLAALSAQVRAMIFVRLAPTPQQLHAVDDLVQQTLLGVAEGLATLRHDTVDALKAFTSTVADRRVADFLRRATTGPTRTGASLESLIGDASASGPLAALLAASSLTPRSAAARAEDITRVLGELGRLRPVYREVITLAFFDQLTVTAIAERMGISRPAASMLLIRAVRVLRRGVTGSSEVTHAPVSRRPA